VTIEQYLEKANSKYHNRYKYIINDWNGICDSTITVICPIHGEFSINARNHILANNKTGCSKCGRESSISSRTEPYDEVINQFNTLYNNLYEYPESNRDTYINKQSKLKMICHKHGEFIKSAQKHLSGQGCPECSLENAIQNGLWKGGYCDTFFEENPELKDSFAYIYYFKINDGEYYKIGITTRDPLGRATSLTSHAKKFGENLKFELIGKRGTTLYKAFKAEQIILEKLNKYRVYRKWSTELFNQDIYKFIHKIF
jgi:hypothetical protein